MVALLFLFVVFFLFIYFFYIFFVFSSSYGRRLSGPQTVDGHIDLTITCVKSHAILASAARFIRLEKIASTAAARARIKSVTRLRPIKPGHLVVTFHCPDLYFLNCSDDARRPLGTIEGVFHVACVRVLDQNTVIYLEKFMLPLS